MDILLILAHKELTDARRNRWFLLFLLGFAVLSTALTAVGLHSAEEYGVAGFARVAASLVNLVLLVVPLMGLTLGAQSLAGERERGSLLYLLAQPVTRTQVLLAKFLGLSAALSAVLAVGFGASGAVMAGCGGGAGQGGAGFVGLVALAYLLALASLALGMCLSVLCRNSAAAGGMALLLWFSLVFLGDLGVLGTALVLHLSVSELLALTLLNPLSVFKIAAVLVVRGNLEVLGPGGLYAVRTLGDGLLPLLMALLGGWVVVPVFVGWTLFRKQEAI